MKKLVMLFVTFLLMVCIAQAGGPPSHRVAVAPPPPPPIYVTPPPPPLPVWTPPRMKAVAGLTVYMTDYRAVLRQNGYPTFNFGEAFGWSTKEAMTEITVGASIPTIADGSFTWIIPIERSGSGIPTVPITVGGFTFGPRPADTIAMKTNLSGERFMLSTPAIFATRKIMPVIMGEWWHLKANVNGTPNTTTTSQAPVDVRQNFNKLIFGVGIAGETNQRPLCIGYKALYTTGGHTSGFLAEADLGYKQDNMSAGIGYRYSVRTITFGTGDFHIDTNGPYARMCLMF
jgi:hypothetical protein